MMSAIAGQPQSELQSYATERAPSAHVIRSGRRLEEKDPQVFSLQQRHFVVGGQHLALQRNAEIAVFPGCFEFEIVGWGIRLPYGKQGEIAREMIRKFLLLFGKAERLELDEMEEAQWASIAKQIDYRRFSIERSPHRYVEGILLDRKGDDCRIEWHDGSKERIQGSAAAPFRLLESGEGFKGFAKFGSDNALQELISISPLPVPSEGDGETMWREWPANN